MERMLKDNTTLREGMVDQQVRSLLGGDFCDGSWWVVSLRDELISNCCLPCRRASGSFARSLKSETPSFLRIIIPFSTSGGARSRRLFEDVVTCSRIYFGEDCLPI